jgi:hypothetical protein
MSKKLEWPTTPADFVKMVQDTMPQVKATATGYEIRTRILELAQTEVFNDYSFKLGAAQLRGEVEGGKFIQSVAYPGADKVLEIANKFNEFVSGKISN